jgi:hypothetical protein
VVEEWMNIKGYDGKYRISNTGKVESTNYNNTGKPKLLKIKVNRYGYNEVKLSKNNKTKDYLVATLVAEHYLKKPAPDMEVIHIGENNIDSVDNLKYGYRSELLYMMYKKGHRKIGKPSKYKISYKGKQYKKKSDMAKDYGLTPKQLFRRLENGWTLDESLEIPIEREHKILNVKLYKYNGKLYSMKQLSILSGIKEKTIYNRLARKWSIEEAVEIPVGKNYKWRLSV